MNGTRTSILIAALLLFWTDATAHADVQPARPNDPIANEAYNALQENCARCHQVGALEERKKPAAGLGNILDLAALARSSPFVEPGNPDGSRLYTMITKGEMPHDVRQQLSDRAGPTSAQIDAIRLWIARLSPRSQRLAEGTGKTRYSFKLELKTDKTTYRKGDRVSIEVRSALPCYLTLININTDGLATVVFPNDFERENVIPANERLIFPKANARYVFPARRIGRETVVAKCSLTRPVPRGIIHNYLEQRFTEVGDYDAHMRKHYGSDSATEISLYKPKVPDAIILPEVSMETAVQFEVQ